MAVKGLIATQHRHYL